jgi:hypothetical protein
MTAQYPLGGLRQTSRGPVAAVRHPRIRVGNSLDRRQAMQKKAFVSFVIIAYNEAANIPHTIAAITELEDLDE